MPDHTLDPALQLQQCFEEFPQDWSKRRGFPYGSLQNIVQFLSSEKAVDTYQDLDLHREHCLLVVNFMDRLEEEEVTTILDWQRMYHEFLFPVVNYLTRKIVFVSLPLLRGITVIVFFLLIVLDKQTGAMGWSIVLGLLLLFGLPEFFKRKGRACHVRY